MKNDGRLCILRILGMGMAALLLALPAWGQGTGQPTEGIDSGNYNVRQSVEFGGKIAAYDGNQGTYDSFVNLYSGPRLLDYSLEVRSLNHVGSLFDSLSVTSFGYGGDPNALSRIRVSKNKWYKFTGLFRYARNTWDYNLLANPLNPATSNPAVAIGVSPHSFQTVRRIGDYDLILFPESRVRARLGYSRTTANGLSFSNMHEGTEALLDQNWRTTQSTYRMGIDFRMLPHTSISYDQFLNFYKGDTGWLLGPSFLPNTLAGGIPVNLGISFNTAAGQPCATPILGTGDVNPSCNAFFAYTRNIRERTFTPTEQLSWQGTYWKRLDVQARGSYSAADVKNPLVESFDGLATRSRLRNDLYDSGARVQRIQTAFDIGLTLHVNNKWRINEIFRTYNFRIPGSLTSMDSALFGATLLSTPNVFSPATCPPPFTAATCPQHISASGPDETASTASTMLRQSLRQNTVEMEYDFTPRLGATIGYRYEARDLFQSVALSQVQTFFPGPTAALANRGACAPASSHPLNPDGTCTVTVDSSDSNSLTLTQHAGLFGLWTRPSNNLRLNFDLELASQSPAGPTRITPRNFQRYKFGGTYSPASWATVEGAVNIKEYRQGAPGAGYLGHNRNYSFSTTLAPRDWFGIDLSYTYTNIKSDIEVCYVATPVPPGALSCGTPFLTGQSFYDNAEHFGSVNFMVKPIKRVSANFGYTINSSDGSSLILNPLQLPGSLRSNYHTPSANILVQLNKNLAWHGAWNYYGFNEKGDNLATDPTGELRDFHAHVGTIGLRYSF